MGRGLMGFRGKGDYMSVREREVTGVSMGKGTNGF